MKEATWRETGSHRMPNGTCCHCGPANALTGPQYDCTPDCATERGETA